MTRSSLWWNASSTRRAGLALEVASLLLVGSALVAGVGASACSHGPKVRSESVAGPKAPAARPVARTQPERQVCPTWKAVGPVSREAVEVLVDPQRRKDCHLGFLKPGALSAAAAGRVWVILGRPETDLAKSAPIEIRHMHAGRVVLTKSLGYGPVRSLTVRVHNDKGELCRGALGEPVILARLSTQWETKLPKDGKAVTPEQTRKLEDLWKRARKMVAAEVKGCKAPTRQAALGSEPVWAEQLGLTAPALVAHDKKLDPAVRSEALTRLRDLLAVQAKFKKSGPKGIYARALAMPKGGTLLMVGAAWGEWPACGAQGQAGSALWYLFRGKWHLVSVWKKRTEPVRLLMAGDLDGDGTMECILEQDSLTGHHVLYHIRNRATSQDGEQDGELIELRSDESANEWCPC